MGLEEEFTAHLQTQQQAGQFRLEDAFKKHLDDLAHGGSIRQAPKDAPFSWGGLAGGIGIGLATGNPAAAVVGAAGGEAIQQLAEHAVGSKNAPESTTEAAQRIVQEGAYMGMGEGVGRGAVWLADKLGRPLVGHMLPEAVAAESYLAGRTSKPVLMPAESTDTRILDVLHNVAEYSVLGGGAVKEFKVDRNRFFDRLAYEVVGRYGNRMTDMEIGRAVVDSAKRNFEAAQMPAKMIYNAIERATAPTYVEVPRRMTVTKTETPVTKSVVARERVKKQEGTKEVQSEEGDISQEPELQGMQVKTTFQDIQVGDRLEHLKVMMTTQEQQMSGAKINLAAIKEDLEEMTSIAKKAGGLADREQGNTLLSFMQQKPDYVSYPVAKAIRTEIRTLRDSLARSPETANAPAIGKANTIYGKLTDQIRAGLREDDPFLAEMWDEANRLEVGAQQTFNNKLIRQLTKQANARGGDAPAAVANSVWNAGKDNTTAITRVRNAVDVSDWHKMQQWVLDDAIGRASQKTGSIDGKEFEKILFGPNGVGASALEAGFDKATVTELREFINVMKIAQERQSEGSGRFLVQMAQGGALSLTFAGVLADLGVIDYDPSWREYLSAGTVLLGPTLLAKVMTNPTGIKWLTEGFSTPAKGKASLALAGKIIQAAFPRPSVQPVAADPVRPSMSQQPMGNVQ